MNAKIIIISLSILISAATCVWGQSSITIPSWTFTRTAPWTQDQKAIYQEQQQLDQQAQQALDANDLPKAEMIAGQGVALGSLSGDDILAQTLYLEGRSQEAFQEYQKIVEQEKGTFSRWLLPYAILELQAGNWAKALKAYNDATIPYPGQYKILTSHNDFDPKNPQTDDLAAALHIALAEDYHQNGTVSDPIRLSRAMHEYSLALTIEPNSPLAQDCYARALIDAKRLPEAKAIFKTLSANTQGDIKADADDALQNRLSNVPDAAPVTSSPQQ